MGGEWSKRIGQSGEDAVARLLRLIGWKATISNYDVPCSVPTKHGNVEEGKHRREHGLDGTMSYRCPLFDATQQHVVVSVKYSDSQYPKEAKLSKKFSEFSRDLTQMCRCYERSSLYQQLTNSAPWADRSPVAGALFWMNNHPPDDEASVSAALVSSRPEAEPGVPLYLVDNQQAAFLHDALGFVRRSFGDDFAFNYQSTGKNLNSRTRRHQGRLLPLQLLNAPEIVVRVTAGAKTLVICSKNPFSTDDLKRLYDLAQYLTLGWANRIIIAFRDYNHLRNGTEAGMVHQMFSDNDSLQNVEIGSFEDDFRNEPFGK